eukprot:GHUV01017289.1.p3 GENE.GHUV01017289.1~~GHUV01017289.1.p3  ORF type:complete len:101 (+),score=36.01 GHUV01017289.1:864-1166(+)
MSPAAAAAAVGHWSSYQSSTKHARDAIAPIIMDQQSAVTVTTIHSNNKQLVQQQEKRPANSSNSSLWCQPPWMRRYEILKAYVLQRNFMCGAAGAIPASC